VVGGLVEDEHVVFLSISLANIRRTASPPERLFGGFIAFLAA
jgi:hypothetical protein